jgi:hypothetical protein
MSSPNQTYPARLDVDYHEPLNRLTTAFRIFVAIPILILIALLSGETWDSWDAQNDEGVRIVLSGLGVLFLPVLLLILFRMKYPRWWFDWNLEFTRFSYRVSAYLALLTDQYPSTDEEQAVHVEIDYPDVERDLNRWLPLVKWLLAIPHYIVLFFLSIAAFIVVIIAWFAILFTGRYPEGMFKFVVGVLRWSLRVQAYAFLLTTDRYPPFSLDPA